MFLYLRVYDIYLAESTLASNVTVVLDTSNTDFTTTLDIVFGSADVLQNADQQVVALNAVSSTMNAVNCSDVDSAYCFSLNRGPCLLTPHTCSSCLTGYNGVSGDSNSRCSNTTMIDNSGKIGDTCSLDSNCFYGSCVSNKCVYPIKSCPLYNNMACGGSTRGKCAYTISGRSISSCTIADTACVSSCSCNLGYAGIACQYSLKELLQRGDARAAMCKKLGTSLKISDISKTMITKFITSLVSIYDPSEITTTANIGTCKDVLDIVLTTTMYTDDTTGTAISFIDMTKANTSSAFISILSKFLTSSSASSSNVVTSIDNSTASFVKSALLGMTNGQTDMELTSNNLKMVLSRKLVSQIDSAVVPLTLEEKSYGKTPIQVQFTNNDAVVACNDSSGYVSMSMGAYTSSPYNTSDSSSLASSMLRSESVYYGGRMSAGGKVKSTNRRLTSTPGNASYYISLPFTQSQSFYSKTEYIEIRSNRTILMVTNETMPSCSQYVTSTSNIQDISCKDCEISYFTNDSVIFACYDITQLCHDVYTSSNDVYMWSSPDIDRELTVGVDDEYYTIPTQTDPIHSVYQVAALTKAVLTVGYDVLSSNPFLINPERAKGILAFVSTITFITFIGMIFFYQWDRKDRQKLIYLHDIVKPRTGPATTTTTTATTDTTDVMIEEKYDEQHTSLKRLMLLIKNSMPLDIDAINDMSLIYRYFIYPFTEHHDVLLPLGKPSLSETRLIRWITFCLMFYFAMFFDTLFFTIFFQDDGNCESLLYKNECLKYDWNPILRDTKCEWDDSNSSCALREPPGTMLFSIITSCVTMLFGVPLTMLYEYLLGEICCKRPDFSTIGWNTMYWVGVASYEAHAATWTAREALAKDESVVPSLKESDTDDKHIDRSSDDSHTTDDDDDHNSSHGSHDEHHHHHHHHDHDYDHHHDDSIAIAEMIYNDSISINDEIRIIVEKARPYFEHPLTQLKRINVWGTAKRWSVGGIILRLKGLLNRFGIKKIAKTDDLDAMFPRIKGRLKRARQGARSILESLGFEDGGDDDEDGSDSSKPEESGGKEVGEIEDSDDLETININQALLQYFILEQLPPFQRYALKYNCFINDYTSPEKVPVLQWIGAWLFIILSILFYIYWVFAWCIRQGGSTFTVWGNILLAGLLEDVFLMQVCQIYIVYVASQSAILSRLLVIRSTLETIAHDIYYHVRECSTDNDKLKIHPDIVDVALVQHFSSACRASRSRHICHLPASFLLQHVNDLDIYHCRTPPYKVRFSLVSFVMMSIPVLLMVISEDLAESAFESIYSFAITTLYGGLTYFIFTAPLTTIITLSVVGGIWIIHSLIQYFYVKTKEVKHIELTRISSIRSNLIKSNSLNETKFAKRRREFFLILNNFFYYYKIQLQHYSYILRYTVVAKQIQKKHDLLWINMNNCRIQTTMEWSTTARRNFVRSISKRSTSDSKLSQQSTDSSIGMHSIPNEITILMKQEILTNIKKLNNKISSFYLERFDTDMQNDKDNVNKVLDAFQRRRTMRISQSIIVEFTTKYGLDSPSILLTNRHYRYMFKRNKNNNLIESILIVIVIHLWLNQDIIMKLRATLTDIDWSDDGMKRLLHVIETYLQCNKGYIEPIDTIEKLTKDTICQYVRETSRQYGYWKEQDTSLHLDSLKISHKLGVQLLDTFLAIYDPPVISSNSILHVSLSDSEHDGSSDSSSDSDTDSEKVEALHTLLPTIPPLPDEDSDSDTDSEKAALPPTIPPLPDEDSESDDDSDRDSEKVDHPTVQPMLFARIDSDRDNDDESVSNLQPTSDEDSDHDNDKDSEKVAHPKVQPTVAPVPDRYWQNRDRDSDDDSFDDDVITPPGSPTVTVHNDFDNEIHRDSHSVDTIATSDNKEENNNAADDHDQANNSNVEIIDDSPSVDTMVAPDDTNDDDAANPPASPPLDQSITLMTSRLSFSDEVNDSNVDIMDDSPSVDSTAAPDEANDDPEEGEDDNNEEQDHEAVSSEELFEHWFHESTIKSTDGQFLVPFNQMLLALAVIGQHEAHKRRRRIGRPSVIRNSVVNRVKGVFSWDSDDEEIHEMESEDDDHLSIHNQLDHANDSECFDYSIYDKRDDDEIIYTFDGTSILRTTK